MNVTVLTKPSCPGCNATKRKLNDLGIAYTAADVTTDPVAYDKAIQLGYSGLPVVIVEDGEDMQSWSGYSPDRLEALAKEN